MREALLNLRPRSLGRSAQSCTPLKLLFPEGGRGCLCFRCSRVVAVRWSCAARACVRMEEPCSDLSPLTRERESNTHLLSSSPPPTRWQSNAMCGGGGGEDRARDPVVSRLIALYGQVHTVRVAEYRGIISWYSIEILEYLVLIPGPYSQKS